MFILIYKKKVFDNQMATMAVLSSHLIIVNHKGEISSNLEQLLGITFFAKCRVDKSKFKPTILFVLRDQIDRQSNAVCQQVYKLKQKLVEQSAFVKESIDDVFNIKEKDLFLLPNAFSEDKDKFTDSVYKWRNRPFSDNVLELRSFILNHLTEIQHENEMKNFSSMFDLYLIMASNWETLEKLGDGILNSKNLEELRVRLELANMACALIEKHKEKFYTDCTTLIDEGIAELEKIVNQSIEKYERIGNEIRERLNGVHRQAEESLLYAFNEQTNRSGYPDELKSEYEDRIRSNLVWVKNLKLKDWDNFVMKNMQKVKFDENSKKFNEKISKMLRDCATFDKFEKEMKELFERQNKEFDNQLANAYESDDKILENSKNTYNQMINLLRGDEDGIFIYAQNIKFKNDIKLRTNLNNDNRQLNERWLHKKKIESKVNNLLNTVTMNKFSESDIDEIVNIFNNKTLVEIKENIKSCNIDDKELMSSLRVFKNKLFNQSNSIILRNKKFYNLAVMVNELIQIILQEIYQKVLENKKIAMEKERNEYKTNCEVRIKKFVDDFWAKSNSGWQGHRLANELFENIFNFMIERNMKNSLEKIDSIFFDVLKSPQNLVELAYRESFGAYCYENVFKYCKDINRFCLEIAKHYSKFKVDSLIDNILCVANMQLRKFFESTLNLFDLFEIKEENWILSTHGFISKLYEENTNSAMEYLDKLIKDIEDNSKISPDAIQELKMLVQNVNEMKKDNIEALVFDKNLRELKTKFNLNFNEEYERKATLYFIFAEFFLYFRNKTIDSPIEGSKESIEHFIKMFKEKIESMEKDDIKFSEKFRKDFNDRVSKELENKVNFYLGCNSTCPGCGSKCHLEKDHIGDHQSNKHILKAFFDWKYTETNEPITEFCWEEKTLYNSKHIDDDDKEYKSSRDYLEQCHMNWLNDIEQNYKKYGRTFLYLNEEARKYKNEVIKAWMNTRKPFIKSCVDMIDKKSYANDWLCWIDNEKELKEDFVPKWKDQSQDN